MKNKDMEKENEIKTMVPTLRFPEFREQTGWEVEFLSNILDYERPDNFIVETETYGEEGIPVLTANKSFILGYTRESTGIYVNLPVIIFDDFTTDKKYVDFPFKVKSSAIKILHTKHTDILRFIYELMNQITFEAKEHKRYYISTYQRIQVPLPKEEEQQKIADCLSSLDELIEATIQKVETLKEHKKGLMQRLFPAEGNNLPDLRFPEFKGAEEWKGYKLKSLCEIGNGKDYKHLGSGNIPLYGSGGYMTSVDDFLYDGESVCIGRKGTIDKPIFLTGKFWTVDTLFYTHSFHNCLPKFLYLIFQQINWYKYNEAGGVPSLSKTTIGEINVFVPVGKKGELKEQQKIADCLFSLDELIEATSRKVEILKEHKKGLMQQLFPKI